MSYSSDLLAQARHLAGKEPRRPKQASLRRAVSAAYYSLFHLLVSEAASSMLRGRERSGIHPVFRRAFVHRHMRGVAESFKDGTVPKAWQAPMGGAPVSEDLRDVASAFVDLQEARHEADYDFGRRFIRSEVRDLIEAAERAASSWQNVRGDPEGQVFLTALLINERIPKPRAKPHVNRSIRGTGEEKRVAQP